MPSCIRDSVMSPLLKGNKIPLCSDNYWPIALSSCISKVLEILIIHKYSSFLQSSHHQFGFKAGSSTSLCTGSVKNIISRYINRGSSVLGCFLDASRAFDLVSHDMLFNKLVDRKLPAPIVCHLGILIRSCVFDGNSLTPGHLVCLMVSGWVVCFLLFCFVFIWMVCLRH